MNQHRLSVGEAYRILGLDQTASLEEVKVAYKQLALRTHPDKNPDNPDATTHFQEIGEAYDKLLHHLDDSRSDESDYYYSDEEEDDIPLSFYFFLFEEMMGGRANRHSRGRFHFREPEEREPEDVYQQRLQREREERAAADARRQREEEISRQRKTEEREKAMKEGASRRKNKAKEKKTTSEQSKQAAEEVMRKSKLEAQSKRSAVFAAARSGQDELVKNGIWERGVDAAGYEDGTAGPKETLLHIAVSKNSLDLISWLDAHSADPEECDGDGLTPFLLAVKLGHLEAIRYFLDSHSPNAETTVFQGGAGAPTALHLALRTRNPEVVWFVFENRLAQMQDVRIEWKWLISPAGRKYIAQSNQKDLYEELKDLFINHTSEALEFMGLEEVDTGPDSAIHSTSSSTTQHTPSSSFQKGMGQPEKQESSPKKSKGQNRRQRRHA